MKTEPFDRSSGAVTFLGLSSESYQKRLAIRKQNRDKHFQERINKGREKYLSRLNGERAESLAVSPKVRCLESRLKAVTAPLAEGSVAENSIENLWQLLVDYENVILSDEILGCLVAQCQKLEANQSSLEQVLWVLVNQCNNRAQIPWEICQNIIRLCFHLVRKYTQKENCSISKESIVFCIIILGNICVSERHVEFILECRILQVIVQDLPRDMMTTQFQDLTFLLANIMYLYPAHILHSKDNQKAERNGKELLLLHRFLQEKLWLDLDLSYGIQESIAMAAILPKSKARKMTAARYATEDLVDILTKIKQICYSTEVKKPGILNHPDCKATVQQINKLSESVINNLKSGVRRNVMGYLKELETQNTVVKEWEIKCRSQKRMQDLVEELKLLLRFARDLLRLPFIPPDHQSRDSNHEGYSLLSGNNDESQKYSFMDCIHRVISCVLISPLHEEHDTVVRYCWEIVQDSLNLCEKIIQQHAQARVTVMDPRDHAQQIHAFYAQELNWLEECVINHGQWVDKNCEGRAIPIYFQHFPRKFEKVPTNFSVQIMGAKGLTSFRSSLLVSFIPITAKKLVEYQQNMAFLSIILESLLSVVIAANKLEQDSLHTHIIEGDWQTSSPDLMTGNNPNLKSILLELQTRASLQQKQGYEDVISLINQITEACE